MGEYKMNVEMIDTRSKPRLEDTARPKGYAGFFKGNPDRNLPPGRILSDLSQKRRRPE
jgi:hypothetical protein